LVLIASSASAAAAANCFCRWPAAPACMLVPAASAAFAAACAPVYGLLVSTAIASWVPGVAGPTGRAFFAPSGLSL
jgi:hypothetical protein